MSTSNPSTPKDLNYHWSGVYKGDSNFSPNPMRGVVKTVISMLMREKLRKCLVLEK